jgi:hypothetical protein
MAENERNRGSLESPPKGYLAEKVRQGRIVLRSTWQRVIFFGGLVAAVIVALLWGR